MKLDFKIPDINDRIWAEPLLKNGGGMGSENAFGSIFIWSDVHNTKICRFEDFVLIRMGKEPNVSNLICGLGNLERAINAITDDINERLLGLKIIGLTKERVLEIQRIMPGKFEFSSSRELWDYIYNVSDLAGLIGKKYQKKRNHVSKFNRMYGWTCTDITNKNIDKCMEVVNRWFENNILMKDQSVISEYDVIKKSIDNYESLKFKGIILEVDSSPIAFTMGEEINSNIFITHFEKALQSYEGSYNVINQEFAKRLMDYRFINREEDLGIEGLRKAKLSYRPEILLEKYSGVVKV